MVDLRHEGPFGYVPKWLMTHLNLYFGGPHYPPPYYLNVSLVTLSIVSSCVSYFPFFLNFFLIEGIFNLIIPYAQQIPSIIIKYRYNSKKPISQKIM